MTLEKALEIKKRIGDTITIDDMIYNVVVAPLRDKDYIMFLETYRDEEITDEYASSFSVDRQFRVSALKVIGGIDVIGKTLYPTKKSK